MFEPLFNKFAGLKACNFIKKRLQHRHFPVNIAKFISEYKGSIKSCIFAFYAAFIKTIFSSSSECKTQSKKEYMYPEDFGIGAYVPSNFRF